MSAAVPKFLRQAHEEWRANPRLRWGALVAGAIAVVYLCLLLVDWRRDKMAALSGQEAWLVRADRARAVAKAVDAEIPRATTIGLAEAEVQTTVRQLLNAFGGKLSSDPKPSVQVAGQPGLWRVPFTLRGITSQAQMLEILRRIESSQRLMVVEEFSFSFVQGAPNLTLTGVAYFRIGPQAAAAGGKRAPG